MADFSDLQLDKPYDPPPPGRRFGWRLLLLIPLLAVVGYLVWNLLASRNAPASDVRVQTEQQVAEADKAQPLEPVSGEEIDLPPLGETDPVVRQLVSALSSHPRVAAWLTTDQLIRNFTVVVVNISNGRSPARHLGAVRPTGEFIADEDGEIARIDARSYRRYDEYADAVGALDAEGTARLYATLKPRIQDAYRELGYPDGDFDRAMERALVELLNTPDIDGDVMLTPKSVSWEFAEPKLQSLSGAQRQFLRMGPRNMRIVKGKLREIAPLLGIALPR
ncbi:MAG TPA: DUF3014 domain-containing protein [Vicinamibacterales bacterium]|nr:DUF3014 domain-containing protein [Vicinamibacterales bacterium]